MRIRYIYLLFIAILTALLISGCSQIAEPEEIYHEYYKGCDVVISTMQSACKEGKFNDAKLLLDVNALETSRKLGACAFTHDAINTIEVQKGNPVRTFNQDPTVTKNDKRASILWLDDQGNIVAVTLALVDGHWKISNTTWSY